MGENSTIEWTHHTFNPWIGCTKVSPACRHCYAERDFDHRYGKVKWGQAGTRVVTSDANWRKPLQWDREAAKSGERKRVFCASLADVFENWEGPMLNAAGEQLFNDDQALVPTSMANVCRRLFDLIDQTPNLDWLLLTKRPENIVDMWPDEACRKNVWLGCSVENQQYADRRVPELLKCHHLSRKLFLSCEPLLGPVDLTKCGNHDGTVANLFDGNALYVGDIGGTDFAWTPRGMINWVIVGGESGPHARPMNPDDARSLIDQCNTAGIPVFFKQWGEWLPFGLDYPGLHIVADLEDGSDVLIGADVDGKRYGENHVQLNDLEEVAYVKVGKKAAGRLFEGVEYSQFPQVGE